MNESLSNEQLAELKRLDMAAAKAPWHVVNNPFSGHPQCGVSMRSDKDDQGTDLFDTFNRGYKVSLIEEDGNHDQDVAGQKDMALVAALRNSAGSLIDQASRANATEEENRRLRQRVLTAAGDDLCRLSQEEIKDLTSGKVPIPPKSEFIPSCERFHAQVARESGVNENCLTLAQMVAENERLREAMERIRTRAAARPVHVCGVDTFDLEQIVRDANAALAPSAPATEALPWKCTNPNCGRRYAEYVNGCPACSEGSPGENWSVVQDAPVPSAPSPPATPEDAARGKTPAGEDAAVWQCPKCGRWQMHKADFCRSEFDTGIPCDGKKAEAPAATR